MNWGRLLRLYTMIAGVSAVSLFVFGAQFSDARLSVAIVAVGTVAFVSVILGAILSWNASLGGEATDPASTDRGSIDAYRDVDEGTTD